MSAAVAHTRTRQRTEPTKETRVEEAINALERKLDAREREVGRLRSQLDALERENEDIRASLAELRGEPTLSIAEALRAFLQSKGPATAKEAELWLRARGYKTDAASFYHSVHATLRAMSEVVGVIKEGETTRFALKEGLKVPSGWRAVEFPRRTSGASRRAQV
jgi:chromosome segregation ATPase